jgi:salicylate hydroxylase
MNRTEKPLQIAIVGGGIGGLTTAVALQKAGLRVDIFEQAQQFTELGAGIGLGKNAALVLNRLGLGEQIEAIKTPIRGLTLRTWRGEVVNKSDSAAPSNAFNSIPMHRADLLTLLHDALPEQIMHTGKKCVAFRQDDTSVQLSFADGSTFTADAIIAADGIHSLFRNSFHPDQPIFANQIAYRGLIPMERLTNAGLEEELQQFIMWMGPHRHFLIFPISRGRIMNVVAFVPPESDWRVESWTAAGDVEQLAAEFRDWDEKVARIISALDKTLRWALYDREHLDFWGVGRVTLLGDAAHAMLPHQGQGAGQSIEDAAFLARCLQRATQETLPQWLRFYEEQRKTRTTQVQQTTRVAGTLYDLPDNEVNRRGENFSPVERMKWVLNYDVDQAFDEALQAQTRLQ